ncbi:transcription initiation factor iie subunit beta [Botrytis cinerea]
MSSFLEKQQAAFAKGIQNTSSKITSKRPTAPVSVPSPAPSNTSNTSKSENKDPKRKREPTNVVYSQPASTGYGTEAFTQVTYVIEFLKKKDEPKTFQEILEYLSQVHVEQSKKQLIAQILRRHDRVQWIADPKLKVQAWDSGTFKHRPIIGDGWPDCEDAINELEKEYKILVTRTKKDNHARMIWINDPTLIHPVESEFQVMWHRTELPSVDDLVRKLLENGQKPASEDPSKRVKVAPKAKEKKRKAPRKGGRTTNTHMAHLLNDYSHMKR